jgi:hypothetical protein
MPQCTPTQHNNNNNNKRPYLKNSYSKKGLGMCSSCRALALQSHEFKPQYGKKKKPKKKKGAGAGWDTAQEN